MKKQSFKVAVVALCTALTSSFISPNRHAFSRVFRNNLRPEVGSDVISGLVVELTGVDVRVKFGDSMSNGSRDIRAAHFVSNERI